jgi:hypothetical protein
LQHSALDAAVRVQYFDEVEPVLVAC